MWSDACVHGFTTHKIEHYIPPDSIQVKSDGLGQLTMNMICVNVQK